MNDYRHVCFKDLENYWRKDEYFENLSPGEIIKIKTNLGLLSTRPIVGTYDEIKTILDSEEGLNISSTYIVTDFQTIYESSGDVFGLGDGETSSKVYSIHLTPINNKQFSKDVQVAENGKAKSWIVRYDFDQKTLRDKNGNEIKTKGTITYLQDQNNNSAYYDFKNIKVRKHLNSSDYSSLTKEDGEYLLYTFNKFDGEKFIDCSDDIHIVNNTFEKNCANNIFLDTTCNNHFSGGFKNNIFFGTCENNKFDWDTANNIFKCDVTHTQGSVQNVTITNLSFFGDIVSKEFKLVYGNINQSLYIVTYFDRDTLTNQIFKLSDD